MRYEKSERLLRLCLMMSGSHQGISLGRIMEEFEVSRKTAERMRDAAVRLLPNVIERTDETGVKYWRSEETPRAMVEISPQDIVELQLAADVLDGTNRGHSATVLRNIADKLAARQPDKWLRRAEPDMEMMLESEGLAHRVGPRVRIMDDTFRLIRSAILSTRVLRLTYSGRLNRDERELLIEPYGLLYATRPYLIGKVPGKSDLRHFRLQGISAAALSDMSFLRDEGFDLDTYRRQFFGSFREPPFECVWKFSPAAAEDAAEYIFHPDQKTERTADGALVVRFRAGGALEMSWHLQTWGDAVEVFEPFDFWQRAAASRSFLVQAGGAEVPDKSN